MGRVLLNNHVLLPDHRIGLLLVPKVATSAIAKSVAASGVRAQFDVLEIPPGYMRIAIVRNTWDRIVSCWHQKTNPAWPEKVHQLHDAAFYTGMPLDAFVAAIAKDIRANHHFYPQDEIVVPYDEVWPLDLLDVLWAAEFGDEITLMHDNVNHSRTTDYAHYYEQLVAQSVAELYAAEIALFGFTFR